MTNSQINKDKGFTLLELLIVIAIIAILSAILIFVLNPAETLRKGRDSQRISDLNTINRAIAFYITTTFNVDLDGDGTRGVCGANVFVGKGSGPDITVPQTIAEKALLAGGATWTDRNIAAGADGIVLLGATIGPSGQMLVVGNAGYIRTSEP